MILNFSSFTYKILRFPVLYVICSYGFKTNLCHFLVVLQEFLYHWKLSGFQHCQHSLLCVIYDNFSYNVPHWTEIVNFEVNSSVFAPWYVLLRVLFLLSTHPPVMKIFSYIVFNQLDSFTFTLTSLLIVRLYSGEREEYILLTKSDHVISLFKAWQWLPTLE